MQEEEEEEGEAGAARGGTACLTSTPGGDTDQITAPDRTAALVSKVDTDRTSEPLAPSSTIETATSVRMRSLHASTRTLTPHQAPPAIKTFPRPSTAAMPLGMGGLNPGFGRVGLCWGGTGSVEALQAGIPVG